MKLNTGAWIGLAGGAIGIVAAIVAVIATDPQSGIYTAIGILALLGGMFFLVYKTFLGPLLNSSRLQKTGIPGEATIVEVRDTGVTVNNSPQVKLVLEIKNNLGQRYTTTLRTLVSRINPGAFQPGMVVAVKIDPKNENNVALDKSGGAAGRVPNEAALKQELEQLQQEQEVLRQSGLEARAIVKSYRWLGAYVNGNNPYVELEMEILPANQPSFSGKARGVIGEASVPKFQPGQEIWVKYDRYDNSKVTIDRS
jgi:hypothetical protein